MAAQKSISATFDSDIDVVTPELGEDLVDELRKIAARAAGHAARQPLRRRSRWQPFTDALFGSSLLVLLSYVVASKPMVLQFWLGDDGQDLLSIPLSQSRPLRLVHRCAARVR